MQRINLADLRRALELIEHAHCETDRPANTHSLNGEDNEPTDYFAARRLRAIMPSRPRPASISA